VKKGANEKTTVLHEKKKKTDFKLTFLFIANELLYLSK
jgi:hypothetical protein